MTDDVKEIPDYHDRADYSKACAVAKATMTFEVFEGMSLIEASCATFPGCHGWGETEGEARSDFFIGLDGWLTSVARDRAVPRLPRLPPPRARSAQPPQGGS